MLASITWMLLLCDCASAQRARFPDFFAPQPSTAGQGTGLPALPNTFQNPSIITSPPANLQFPALPQNNIFPPPGSLPSVGTPAFNSTQAPSQPFPIFPRATQPQAQPLFQVPALPQNFGQPNFGGAGQSPFGFQGPRQTFNPSGTSWPQQAWTQFRDEFLPRLIERPRARQTYLQGNNGNELNINDIEVASTLNIQNFARGNQPLRISPGFIFHFWDGPDSAVTPGFDLPAQAYSAYLTFDHITDPALVYGFENSFTVGYFSDFDNTSSDAIRLTARLLGWRRLNSYTVGKLGIEYFDRVDVKILPAVGFFFTPNPDIKFDLYFPRTKLAHRLPNLGDVEVWGYAGGEYGGGSWAVDRADGTGDQVDINDVRAFIGAEWIGPRRVTGFFEFGYVFERELVFRSNALDVLDLQDTLFIRSGFAY